MKMSFREPRSLKPSSRKGVAAIECAIVAPLLTLLVLGAIDVGQYANVYQKVSDASREGARVAVKFETREESQVTAAVMDYMQQVFPNVSPSVLASAVNVNVTNAAGNPLPSGDMTSAASGSQVSVTVTLQFDLVRWISHVQFLDGREAAVTTMMRRE